LEYSIVTGPGSAYRAGMVPKVHAPYSYTAFRADSGEPAPRALVSAQVPSLPTRNEWGESWREGYLNKTYLLSPALSSFLRQEEREKCFAIGHFSTCEDTIAPGMEAFVTDGGP
jgi:hypothetical protein